MDNANFVDPDYDVTELLQTFAEDDFVLTGDSVELYAIFTRHNILYFINYQVEPFLKIGEALRYLCENCRHDLD